MKNIFVYEEEYNVESHVKKNTLKYYVNFDHVMFIEQVKINTSSGSPIITVVMTGGKELSLPRSCGDKFIGEYLEYMSVKNGYSSDVFAQYGSTKSPEPCL